MAMLPGRRSGQMPALLDPAREFERVTEAVITVPAYFNDVIDAEFTTRE
jgi:hypothetical protein